jgi:hypothetical protein
MENKKARYSCLSKLINDNLKSNSASYEDFFDLISQSFEFISKEPTRSTKEVHNKFLEIAKIKYTGFEPNALIENYRIAPDTLIALECRFEIDPSDMALVLALAIKYLKNENKQRAKQLLYRVASSGYTESKVAKELIAINFTSGAFK